MLVSGHFKTGVGVYGVHDFIFEDAFRAVCWDSNKVEAGARRWEFGVRLTTIHLDDREDRLERSEAHQGRSGTRSHKLEHLGAIFVGHILFDELPEPFDLLRAA